MFECCESVAESVAEELWINRADRGNLCNDRNCTKDNHVRQRQVDKHPIAIQRSDSRRTARCLP